MHMYMIYICVIVFVFVCVCVCVHVCPCVSVCVWVCCGLKRKPSVLRGHPKITDCEMVHSIDLLITDREVVYYDLLEDLRNRFDLRGTPHWQPIMSTTHSTTHPPSHHTSLRLPITITHQPTTQYHTIDNPSPTYAYFWMLIGYWLLLDVNWLMAAVAFVDW